MAPLGRGTNNIPVNQKRGGKALEIGRQVYGGCCLADSALVAGYRNNHVYLPFMMRSLYKLTLRHDRISCKLILFMMRSLYKLTLRHDGCPAG